MVQVAVTLPRISLTIYGRGGACKEHNLELLEDQVLWR